MTCIDLASVRCAGFDTGGVVSDTARVYAAAWKQRINGAADDLHHQRTRRTDHDRHR